MATALIETKKSLPKRNSFSIESLIGHQTSEPERPDRSPSPRDHRTRDSPSPEVENRCSAFTGNDMSLKHLANTFSGQMDLRLFQPLKMCNRLAPGLPMSPLVSQQMTSTSYPSFSPLMYSFDRPGHSPGHSWIHPGYAGFQHPRFPIGPHPSLFFHPYRKPKRNRTAFSPSQLLQLEQAFEKNHYVVGQERKQLASKLQLSETQVKVWFQNRRTKHKRTTTEDETSVTSQQDEGDVTSGMHEQNAVGEHARTLDSQDIGVNNYDSEKDSSFSDEELPVDVGT